MTPEEHSLLTDITSKVNALTEAELDNLSNVMQWTSHNADPRPLSALESNHLENILITQRQISMFMSKVILHILKKRNVIGK